MRVTGIVRDATTGIPIGGAVLTADDGRSRLAVTDPLGRFSVKTRKRSTALTASAPSYQTTTVPVSGDSRYPVAYVDLQPNSRPSAEHVAVNPVAASADDGTAAKFKDLQDLYDRRLISAEEYRSTRKRLIGDL